MRSFDLSRSLLVLVSSALLASLLGCSDSDPVDPGGNPGTPADTLWTVVELPADLPNGGLSGIALRDNSSVAVGFSQGGNGILLENSSQGWRKAEIGPLPSTYLMDAAIDGFGRRVIVGATPGFRGVILAERPDWTSVFSGTLPQGAFQAVAVDDAGTFIATGSGSVSYTTYTGTAEGTWTALNITSPGIINEKALVDIAYGAGTWVACGWNDGGDGSIEEPYRILMIDEGTGWGLILPPCGGCSGYDFQSVAIDDAGLIYLGGSITDFSAVPEGQFTAFLWAYARDTEEWTEIVLPNATAIEKVNDILISMDGDIYLACGEISASLVRLPGGGGSTDPKNIEWSDANAHLRCLAQSNSGTVYAVGGSLGSATRPLMLERDPIGEELPVE